MMIFLIVLQESEIKTWNYYQQNSIWQYKTTHKLWFELTLNAREWGKNVKRCLHCKYPTSCIRWLTASKPRVWHTSRACVKDYGETLWAARISVQVRVGRWQRCWEDTPLLGANGTTPRYRVTVHHRCGVRLQTNRTEGSHPQSTGGFGWICTHNYRSLEEDNWSQCS